jgi:hypothetical protein
MSAKSPYWQAVEDLLAVEPCLGEPAQGWGFWAAQIKWLADRRRGVQHDGLRSGFPARSAVSERAGTNRNL